jgi:hypothetical protein
MGSVAGLQGNPRAEKSTNPWYPARDFTEMPGVLRPLPGALGVTFAADGLLTIHGTGREAAIQFATVKKHLDLMSSKDFLIL